MTVATNNNAQDRQYLKAMGIDLWVPKDHEPMALTGIAGEVELGQAAIATSIAASTAPKALAACSTVELSPRLPGLNVVAKVPDSGVELLVVTDSPMPSGENLKLLTSMFAAIKIDAAQWLQATISNDESSDTLEALAGVVKPQAIVLMLRTGGQLNALDKLRGQQFQLPSLSTFAVVTFHPQDLIDNAEIKRPAWEDLKLLRQRLG